MKAGIAPIVLAASAAAAVVAAGVGWWVIVGKSSPHASVDASVCAEKPRELAKLTLSGEREAPPEVRFLRDGKTAESLDQFRGTPVLVNFWATWCAPCVKELPALDRLRSEAGGDLHVVPVSEDRTDPATVRRFLEVNGLDTLPVLIDPNGQTARALGVQGIPTTILFDSKGRQAGWLIGIAEWDAPPVRTYLRDCLRALGAAE